MLVAGRVPRLGAIAPTWFLSLVEGDGTTATVFTAPATLPKVRVTTGPNGTGSPVQGAVIDWTVDDQSRVNSGGGFAATGMSVTDFNGYATINWRLDTLASGYGLTASLRSRVGQTYHFTATATAGAPAKLQSLSQLTQGGTVASGVGSLPSVRVLDAFDNPVAGQTVVFGVVAGGGVATGALQSTAADGSATVGGWTLGSTIGVNIMRTTCGALTLDFTATAAAGAATQVVQISGNAQSQTVGLSLPLPQIVEVRDVSNQPVQGEPVTFQVTGPGGFSASQVINTDVNGRAAYTPVLGTTVGTFTSVASIAAGASASFTATGTVGVAARLAYVVQPPSSGTTGADLPGTATVEVTDAYGNRRTTDNTSIVALVIASGSATLPQTTATVVNGLASFPIIVPTGSGQIVLRATCGTLVPADSNAITLLPPVAAVLVIGQGPTTVVAGQVIQPPVTVRVEDGAGNLVTTDNTRPIAVAFGTNPGGATLGGTLTQPTVNGIATFNDLSPSAASAGATLIFTTNALTSATSAPFNATAPGAAYPNEPGGMTQLFLQPFDAAPPLSPAKDAYGWKRFTANLATGSDVTAPGSAPGIVVGTFPTSLNGGSAPFNMVFQASRTDMKRLYLHFFLKIDPAFTNNGNTGTKLMWAVQHHSLNHYINFVEGIAGTGKMFALNTQFGPGLGTNVNGASSFFCTSGNRGRWLEVEMDLHLNTPGVADGTYKCWVDRVLVINEANRLLIPASVSPYILANDGIPQINPTYGGGPNKPPTAMTLQFDHMYASYATS